MTDVILTVFSLILFCSVMTLLATVCLIASLWCWREWLRPIRPAEQRVEVIARD